MTKQQLDSRLRALVELVHQLRPSWDRPGITGAIHASHRPGRDLPAIIRAAIDAALDPTANTPAVIPYRDGAAWTPSTPPPSRPPRTGRSCRRCGNVHVDAADTDCVRPADPDTRRAALAAARAALADAPRPETEAEAT